MRIGYSNVKWWQYIFSNARLHGQVNNHLPNKSSPANLSEAHATTFVPNQVLHHSIYVVFMCDPPIGCDPWSDYTHPRCIVIENICYNNMGLPDEQCGPTIVNA